VLLIISTSTEFDSGVRRGYNTSGLDDAGELILRLEVFDI
jgi:hypothetical protein